MNNFLVTSIRENNNFTKNFLALSSILEQTNLKIRIFNPIYSNDFDSNIDNSLSSQNSIEYNLAFDLLSSNKKNDLLELITENFYNDKKSYEISLIYGRYPYNKLFLNIYYDIANTLNASQIILLDIFNLDEAQAVNIVFVNYIYTLEHQINVAGLILTEYNPNSFNIKLFLEKLNLLCNKSDNKLIDFIGYILKIDNNQHLDDLYKININKIKLFNNPIKNNVSPIFFRYKLIQLAKKSLKTIVLPEGDEIRTINAAIVCARKNIARLILLANPDSIYKIVTANKLSLPKTIEIINPEDISDSYVHKLYELRKYKGLSLEDAKHSLQDNVVLGTMMLYEGVVDGLVSGAVHTTANTILPALQVIKLSSESTIVSSIFFMLMPTKVVIFADCAVNTNPTIEQLAEITISSVKSAKSFGIDPKVAMISYSTKDSGKGKDVDFVKNVTDLVKKLAPDLLIDGPLQYDAAYVQSVGKQKAPDSKVAGDANVFIFPNLNTGNTVYKAVQRSADITSIGPILQGLKKPVNDLSRGALVDDIIYTIAITAIQANAVNK